MTTPRPSNDSMSSPESSNQTSPRDTLRREDASERDRTQPQLQRKSLEPGPTEPREPAQRESDLEQDSSRDGSANRVRDLIRRVRKSSEPSPHDLPFPEPCPPRPVDVETETDTRDEVDADTPGVPDDGDALPQQLGRFQIERQLGRGGFGLVMLARDPQLNRPVALKVPKLDALFSNAGRQRFLREAQAAALLGHPHIVSVYEAGQSGPLLYIAFEWIDGLSLAEFLSARKSEIPESVIIEVMLKLAAAVQHAHQRGIWHRDLKPANILLQRPQPAAVDSDWNWLEQPKIADFGLAKIDAASLPAPHPSTRPAPQGSTQNANAAVRPNDPPAPPQYSATATGDLLGTPRYAAPESLRGRLEQMGPAVDIYGLGAILYEMMTGYPPFTGESLAQIIQAVETQRPTAPRRWRRDLSANLEAICLKCLEKNPQARYRSAAELEEELLRLQSGRPIQARVWTWREQTWHWLQRNRALAVWLTVVFTLLSCGLIVATIQANRLGQLFNQSERYRIKAESNLTEAQSQRERVERLLAQSQNTIDEMLVNVAEQLEAVPQMDALRSRLLAMALTQEQALANEVATDEQGRLRVAKALIRVASLARSLGQTAEATRAIEQFRSQWPDWESQAQSTLPELRAGWGKLQLIESYLLADQSSSHLRERLQHILDQISGWISQHDHHELLRIRATALAQFAVVLRDQGDFQPALDANDHAIESLQAIPPAWRRPADHLDRIAILSQKGNIHSNRGQNEQAIKTWLQVLAEEQTIPADFPHQLTWLTNRALTEFNLGRGYSSMRNYVEADKYYRSAAQQLEQLQQQFPNHPLHLDYLITVQSAVGTLQQNQGQYPTAIESFERGIALCEQYEKQFGPARRITELHGNMLGNVGNLYFYQQQDPQRAESAWSRSVTTMESLLQDPQHSDNEGHKLANVLGNLAMYRLASNQLEEAGSVIKRGLEVMENCFPQMAHRPDVVDAYQIQLNNAAIWHCLRGETEPSLLRVEQIGKIDSQNPEAWTQAALTAGKCFQGVTHNAHSRFPSDQAERDHLAEPYAAKCLEMLQQAKALGAKNLEQLQRRPEFSGIDLTGL